MNVKETLEQCLYAWKKVQKMLDARHYDHIGRDYEWNTFKNLDFICSQEVKALEHDLEEVSKDEVEADERRDNNGTQNY